jgi:hypothetical protein
MDKKYGHVASMKKRRKLEGREHFVVLDLDKK